MTDANQTAVAVIGSLNIDYFTRVRSLPSPGETVASESLELFRGGKGANQAIAAARQGVAVRFFGTVGEDEEGRAYRTALAEEGIDIDGIVTVPGKTGAAFITVDRAGENTIVTAPGANAQLTPERVRESASVIESCGALLAQFEVPLPSVVEAMRLANGAGIPTVLNPSPIPSTPWRGEGVAGAVEYVDFPFPWHEVQTDYLIVNEGEAEALLDFPPLDEEASTVSQRLHELRVEHLVVTRGGDETLVYRRSGSPFDVETLPVLPIDTVGAGDAFAGCFTARIASGEPLEEAVRAANCAGALTTLGPGAQIPVPDRDMVDQHLEHLSASS